jgi:hypothetical protein
MRHYLLLFLLCLCLPCAAQTVIDDLQISPDGEVINIRVVLKNTGTVSQSGPLLVELFARKNASEEWQAIYSWNDIPGLAAGYRISRDYFSEDQDLVYQWAGHHDLFQVRATVTGPDLSLSMEKTAEHDHDH